MRILILGGTVFLGRHLVDAAQARGHSVTLFNRGQHNPELFPDVEKLRGDRDGGLDALRGRCWDAVIDTCGYVPRIVRQSAELLAGSVGHYTFISSLSVYADFSAPGMDEQSLVGTLDDESVEQVTGETYGPLKALCEKEVERVCSGNRKSLLVRAGLIVGPDDISDRFTYWPHRVAQGGEVLAPGHPDERVQFIDVRDLSEWVIHATENGVSGPVNATGPDYPLSMKALLQECAQVSGSDACITWVSESFLLEQGAAPWSELPLWVPVESDSSSRGFSAMNIDRSKETGMRFRPLSETIRDTLAWSATRPSDYAFKAGLTGERESALLAAWHAQRRV